MNDDAPAPPMVETGPPPLLLPRGLIFVASTWLIGCWLLTIGIRMPVQAVSASYTPGVRLMLLCVGVGLLVGWPLLRLSQRPAHYPVAQTLLDLVVLVALTQVVIWPLRLVTPWSIPRTAAIDLTLMGWLAVVAAIVTAAIGSRRPGVRTASMAACLGLCLLGPALDALAAGSRAVPATIAHLSPLLEVHALSDGGGAPPEPATWTRLAGLVVGAAVLWIALIVALRRARGIVR